ncbi:MAG: U32 family peptidase [Methanobacteriaceae archaeon]|nr:U32 family peptidase [Methanobacteriaceae archaeon]
MKIPELLAPVGSAEHLKIAILSGASSIYLSGEEFGARKYAENFNIAEIREAVKYAHLYNVKVYVTVNTLIKENELAKVSKYLLQLYEIGVDAVLIQDIGLVKLIKENIPKLTIHASTQMNIHNIEGIKWAKSQGIKRIVLPREIQMNELKELVEYAHSEDIEIEVFAHGALCYCYSGHCLMSSFQGGRSGNRGTCAQPCREAYELIIKDSAGREKLIDSKTEGKYILSPRDLSLFENLSELANLNVDSIKIEGRMRSKDYVATVVSNYRQRLNELRHDKSSEILNQNIKNAEKRTKNKQIKNYDKKKQEDRERIRALKNEQKLKYKESIEELDLVFNREFTTGHLIPKNRQDIMNNKKPGHSGLYIGDIHRYNEQTQEIMISLHDNLITIPEKGDGLLVEINPNNQINDEKEKIRDKKTKRDKQKNIRKGKGRKSKEKNYKDTKDDNRRFKTYGFDISAKPTIKDPKDKYWRKREKDRDIKQRLLVVKKVRENKKVPIELKKGDKVYLTKRNALNKNLKDLINDKEKQSYKNSVLELYFRIDEDNCPNLKGNLKLDNGKTLTVKVKGDKWEEAIKKPVSGEIIEKQILKIGDLPYYIKDIKINLNSKRLFAPMSEINKLRREFFDKLEEEIINSYKPSENDLKEAKIKIREFNEKLSKKDNNTNNSKDINCTSEKNLAIYINDLDLLEYLSNNNSLKDGSAIYDRIYLEIPSDKKFEDIVKDNLENYNPLKSKKINVSYCVNFLKKAILLSKNKNYELIWKWPDICHKDTKEALIQILGIINKMDLNIDVMTSLIGMESELKDKFNVKVYGNYPLNVFNIETVQELNKFESLSVSPELYKGNISKLLEDYNKLKCENKGLPELELLVQGNIESMISRKDIISKKQLKLIERNKNKDKNNENHFYLKNRKNQYYEIKTNINDDNLIILNSEELSLIDEIKYLKSYALSQFVIDGRWKDIDYIKEIGIIYKQVIKNDENIDISLYQDVIKKYSNNITKGNFTTGLK